MMQDPDHDPNAQDPQGMDASPDPQNDDAPEPLPEQEELWRPPARFGSVPVEAEPMGWDRRQGFRKHYPLVNLPTQIVERVQLGTEEPHEPNRLIWGDNLHVMRQIPSNTIDLIYADPPFFSGRQYNVMWGDANEMRSFSDIWEGGLTGYLVWLNARLYEMKRLLKPTGSIYLHCDDHASHYIKVEMDKIFGYDNFRNDLVWRRATAHNDSNRYGRILDHILYYVMNSGSYTWNGKDIATPKTPEQIQTSYPSEDERGRYRTENLTAAGTTRHGESGRAWKGYDIGSKGVHWRPPKTGTYAEYIEREFIPGYRDISGVHDRLDALDAANLIHHPKRGFWPGLKRYAASDQGIAPQSLILEPTGFTNYNKGQGEWLGYPTQKPEALIERIIKASSNEGDVVADFVGGGGTTAATAQRLGRRWITCDQSRVAVSVSAERLKQDAITRGLEDAPVPDFTVEHWGIYEAERLSRMPLGQFREFVLRAYGATRVEEDAGDSVIHGWRNQFPIWVGLADLDSQATADDVLEFANAVRRLPHYRDAHLRDGTMLAWGFRADAEDAAKELREREALDVNFVRLSQVRIGDPGFREHIVGRSTDRADYSEFLTFVHPPVVTVAHRALGGRAVTFDAGDSAVVNLGAEVVNVQWDFDYDGQRFVAEPGYSFQRDKRGKVELRVTHKFDRAGTYQVACRVQDSRGGEGTWSAEIEVKS